MKIETQPQDDCQVTVQVEVEPEQLDAALKRAARAISQRVKIPGFRPGKAPYSMVVQHVGEETVREEAIDLLVDEIYPQVIRELDLRPAYPGSLTNVEVKENNALGITFVVPLQPEVSLGDYRSVRVPYEWQPPGEEAIEVFLKTLQLREGELRAVEDRPLQSGDWAVIDISFRPDKAPADEAPLLQGNPIVYIREDNQNPDEMPFPGFSMQLIGLRKGERKTIVHKYSKDTKDESVRGKKIVHEVVVQEIFELPPLDDAFAQKVGAQTLEELRQQVTEMLQGTSRGKYNAIYARRVVEEIRKGASLRYPPQALEEQIQTVLEEIKADLAEDGLDLETYLKSRALTLEQFLEQEVRPRAREELEHILILDEIGEQERLEVKDEDVEPRFESALFAWMEAQQEQSGKAKTKPPKPPQAVVQQILRRSIRDAWLAATLQRVIAIGRGEAPELTAETDATADARSMAEEPSPAVPEEAAAPSSDASEIK